MQRELSSLEYSVSLKLVLKPRPIPMPAEIGYSLQIGRGGSLDRVWGVQTHSGPPVFLVPYRKDLARMNGRPQPSQKWLPVLGIEPGSLDHESQPLTIGPLLTPCLPYINQFSGAPIINLKEFQILR